MAIALDFQSNNPLENFRRSKGIVRGTDFLTKPSKVLELTTSWIATVSLKESFLGSYFVKERKPLFSLTARKGIKTTQYKNPERMFNRRSVTKS